MTIIATANIQELVSELGPTLVAFIANNRNRTVATQWLNGLSTPTQQESDRLLTALRLFRSVAQSENSYDIARLWMISANVPSHGMPAMAIRQGDYDAAEVSAHRMAENAYS